MKNSTIRSYLGNLSFNSCQDISRIHLEYVERNDELVAKVKAAVPAMTTNQRSYDINVVVDPDGKSIYRTSCSCPVGVKCKHIYKVLCRIAASVEDPIGTDEYYVRQKAKRKKVSKQMARGAFVYIAIACKSELDSGSDFRYSWTVKDTFDEEILGVFFDLENANKCARNYVENDLVFELSDDEEEEDDEDADNDDDCSKYIEEFTWEDENPEGHEIDKVWVEQRAIQDASTRFHK